MAKLDCTITVDINKQVKAKIKEVVGENERLKKIIADRDNDLTIAYMAGSADSDARTRVLVKAVKEKDEIISIIIEGICDNGEICPPTIYKQPELELCTGSPDETKEICLECIKRYYTEKVRGK